MVDNVLKYGSNNLVILYCCVYSGLLNTMGVVIQNSIRLMRNAGSSLWVDRNVISNTRR